RTLLKIFDGSARLEHFEVDRIQSRGGYESTRCITNVSGINKVSSPGWIELDPSGCPDFDPRMTAKRVTAVCKAGNDARGQSQRSRHGNKERTKLRAICFASSESLRRIRVGH